MKKFSFSLQKLLNYREQIFDSEMTVLGEMRSALTEMEENLVLLREERKERSAILNELAVRGTTAQEMELHRMYITVVDNNIEKRQVQIRLQKKAIDRQTDKVREAKIEVSTMEKLREKKLEEYQYLAAKAEEQFIEEFVSNTRASALAQAGA